MTTNILLTLIAVLLLVRIVLQVWRDKRAYYTTRAVKRVVVDGNSIEDLRDKLCEKWWWSDYEIVSVIKDRGIFYAFLQSKEIKSYIEK